MPFFTVIIPLYNKESFVENALKSILAQTFTDFEVIVVEDCSTDNSLAAVSRIVSDKIKLIQHDTNKGLSASRNTGIRNAAANYVTFLDADDTWKSGYLEKIKSLIARFEDAQVFATNYEELYQDQVVIVPNKLTGEAANDGLIPDFFERNLGKPIYCSCSVCFNKSVFDAVGFYDETITFGEDVDFNIRVNARFRLAYSPEALVTYTMFSENQITNSTFKNKTIPDFNRYEPLAAQNSTLKKYLDFNRYILARNYKMAEDWEQFQKMKQEIDSNNLNVKQRLLLNAPLFLLRGVKKIKQFFIGKGKLMTTYN